MNVQIQVQVAEDSADANYRAILAACERTLLEHYLSAANRNVTHAAAAAGMHRRTFYHRMVAMGVKR